MTLPQCEALGKLSFQTHIVVLAPGSGVQVGMLIEGASLQGRCAGALTGRAGSNSARSLHALCASGVIQCMPA